MKSPNWIRITLCGFVAGVIWNLLSVVFLAIFAPTFVASVQRAAPNSAQGGAFFFAVDVLMGVWVVWLYSAIAPKYGTNLTTKAMAGLAWWILKTLQSSKWAGLGFVTLGANLLPLGVATLSATLLATVVGAWLYAKAGPAPHDLLTT